MLVSQTQLSKIMRGNNVADFVDPINAAMAEFDITTPLRIQHFLAQVAHESGCLQKLEEGLYYKDPARLVAVWPKRFPTVLFASDYAKNPEKLANYVYANRGGNKGPESGDGWRYRGSGAIQLTFHDNHIKCAQALGIPLDMVGEWLRSPVGACRSAAWFFKVNGCCRWADANDLDGVSDAVNLGRQTEKEGDAIGYEDRAALLKLTKQVIV